MATSSTVAAIADGRRWRRISSDGSDEGLRRHDSPMRGRALAFSTSDLASGTVQGGEADGDTIIFANGVSTIENVIGVADYGDEINGDSRANRLSGLGGDDLIRGRGEDDVLDGGDGYDQLEGETAVMTLWWK